MVGRKLWVWETFDLVLMSKVLFCEFLSGCIVYVSVHHPFRLTKIMITKGTVTCDGLAFHSDGEGC